MEEAVRHVQVCFPEADILLLGVSDRSHQEEGEFETMPAVLALLHTQGRLPVKQVFRSGIRSVRWGARTAWSVMLRTIGQAKIIHI